MYYWSSIPSAAKLLENISTANVFVLVLILIVVKEWACSKNHFRIVVGWNMSNQTHVSEMSCTYVCQKQASVFLQLKGNRLYPLPYFMTDH